MQLEIVFTPIQPNCHCTAEAGCEKPAIAAFLVTRPDGEPQTSRFLCLDHLNDLSDQMTEAMFKGARAVMQHLGGSA